MSKAMTAAGLKLASLKIANILNRDGTKYWAYGIIKWAQN